MSGYSLVAEQEDNADLKFKFKLVEFFQNMSMELTSLANK